MSASADVNQDMFDESATDTLKREGLSVVLKLKYTLLMLPGDREEAISRLKQWDLWGPLVICLVFALGIGLRADPKYSYDSFVNVFIIFWLGGSLASVNCRLLGNKGPIFQSVSIIGYCMLPLALMGLIAAAIPRTTPSVVNLVIVLVGLVWSTVSCLIVMRDLVSQTRKFLCAYPVLLFYIFLGWYAIVA